MDADRLLLIRCLDLTVLEEHDDEQRVRELCARAVQPVSADPGVSVAAVCVWPRRVPAARASLVETRVRVAAATGGFPDPSATLGRRLDEIHAAIDAGADEVDVVVDRALVTDPSRLAWELAATRAAAGTTTWKAILETGALEPGAIRTLASAAIAAGADFLKTSTGKIGPGATPEAAAILAEEIARAGRPVGLKVSGGIRGAAQAAGYLDLVRGILGPGWPVPATFRIGASSLLDALLA